MKQYLEFLKSNPKAALILLVGGVANVGLAVLRVVLGSSLSANGNAGITLLSLAVSLFLYWGYAQYSKEPKKTRVVANIFGYSLLATIPFIALSYATLYFFSQVSLPFESGSALSTLLVVLPETIGAAYIAGVIGEYVSGREVRASYPFKTYLQLLYIQLAFWVVQFALALVAPEVAKYINLLIAGLAVLITYTYAIYWFTVVAPPEEPVAAEENRTKGMKKDPYKDEIAHIAAVRAEIAEAREELRARGGNKTASDSLSKKSESD